MLVRRGLNGQRSGVKSESQIKYFKIHLAIIFQANCLPNEIRHCSKYGAHIVSSKKFLRISSSPHKTLPNDKYDALKELCGERKLFYSPLKKLGQKQISDVRALTLCS